ncbi:polymorphic toxin-type HINT domain-containing protein [Moraxella catarrhalis]|uniref:polymorphic toxin-type HINT domain-containing protein n=2 Tax=Moraxella catarrhalis TaxID=480 RepID=UPI001EB35211|nr:adhesin [Moraxella catarrhalis]
MGWLKASLLEQGMTLLDKHGLPNVTILSQTKLTHTDTVYNFEVQDFHTYHIGEYGVWVHNDGCCGVDVKTSPLPVAGAKRSDKVNEIYKSNPKHTLGQTGNRPNAGIEPRNSFELFENSFQSGNKRYSIDSDGNIHQFANSNDGTWHWAGRTGKDQPESQRLNSSNIPNNFFGKLGTTYNKVKRK